jgi:hypothetical protein
LARYGQLRFELQNIGLRRGPVRDQAVGIDIGSDTRPGFTLTNIGQFARDAQIVTRLGQLQREAARLKQVGRHLCGQALQRGVIGKGGGGQIGIGGLPGRIPPPEQIEFP